jgi:AraC family transcriptional regulator
VRHDDRSLPSPAGRAPGIGPPTADPTVLVVEDDPRVRSLLREALQRTNRVLEAPDGETALGLLKRPAQHSVALLVVDHVLPRCRGLDVLREVRCRWPWIPVVVITGHGSEELAIEALRAGASDYLKKPIDLNELEQRVNRLTRQRPAEGSEPGGAVPPPSPPAVGHPGLAAAMDFLRRHFAEPIGLADVAREAALSRYHFCRIFRRETGASFRDHLRTLRIEQAKRLLADRHLTVTEIAYAVGFNDASRFDKNFSRIVGMTPTAYRRLQISSGREASGRRWHPDP